MARTGTTSTPKNDPAGEVEVDYMAEAPPARPYSEAITDSHRALLAVHGIDVPE